MGDVFASAAVGGAALQWALPIRAAVYGEAAQRAEECLIIMKKTVSKDWREVTLDRIRGLIQEAVPDMIEERKWKKASNGMAGVPVWSHDGIVCTGETYKNYVKMTFAKGAFVKDPAGLFNAGLDGNLRRAIDIHEHDRIDEKALKALIRAAVRLNAAEGAAG
jgi:hypothetical protein